MTTSARITSIITEARFLKPGDRVLGLVDGEDQTFEIRQVWVKSSDRVGISFVDHPLSLIVKPQTKIHKQRRK